MQAVAFPDADALKRALKQNLSCLAVRLRCFYLWHDGNSREMMKFRGKEAYDVSMFYWETGFCQRTFH